MGQISIHGRKLDGGNIIPVLLYGSISMDGQSGVPLLVDELGALVEIPWLHYLIHEGRVYQADTFAATVADDGTLILSTPDPIGVEAHFTASAQCGGDATLELIENAQPTGGVARVARNLNRNHADGFNALSQPTLGGGTVISGPILLPGGRGPQAGGGSLGTRPDLEWETQDDVAYAVRLTNTSGNNQPASIVVNFYSE